MIMEFRPCIIIPIYNHKQTIVATVGSLDHFGLPCFIVDDGSDGETQQVLQSIAAKNAAVTLHRLAHNQGKGAAVMAGMELALRCNYTHALQIDADGQHDTGDVAGFLASARQNPAALVTGQPVFDASAPKVRILGRRINHFFVAMDTLSIDPPDTMCGFRVYPLASVQPLLGDGSLGRRMDFDIEIMVRLMWTGTPVARLDTRVTYPENGSSHFRYLSDNLLIVGMHFRLFFGMLYRLPALLIRKWKTPRTQHWSQIGEKGTASGIKMLFRVHRVLGEKARQIILFPVVLYFFLTSGHARAASLKFLNKAFASGTPHKYLRQKPSLLSSFRHFLSFAHAAIDKAASWCGDIKHDDIVFENRQELLNLIASRTGIVVISAHLGNIELCRALADSTSAPRLNALMFTEHATKYNSVLRQINPQVAERVIHLEQVSPETAINLKCKIDDGEIIVILGDRTPVHSENRCNRVTFLGEEAPFAQGPFILAALMDCPVYLMFCLKKAGKYHVYFERFAERMQLPRKAREQYLQKFIQQYAKRLEYYCLQEPFQWFNFFDFWRQDRRQPITSFKDPESNAHAYPAE